MRFVSIERQAIRNGNGVPEQQCAVGDRGLRAKCEEGQGQQMKPGHRQGHGPGRWLREWPGQGQGQGGTASKGKGEGEGEVNARVFREGDSETWAGASANRYAGM